MRPTIGLQRLVGPVRLARECSWDPHATAPQQTHPKPQLGPQPKSAPLSIHPPPSLGAPSAASAALSTEFLPKNSLLLPADPADIAKQAVASVSASYSSTELDAFGRTLNPRIQAMLNQPFGKPNLSQCFYSEAALRHVLVPVLKSRLLAAADWQRFAAAVPVVQLFLQLWTDLLDIDFHQLPGFKPNWEAQDDIDADSALQATAALLLQFDGDAAALVRWLGGPHVGAHRDVPHILETLKGTVPDSDLADLRRLFTQGMPARFNAAVTDKNYRAYAAYGNHSTVDDDPVQARQTLVKEQKKGYCVPLDKRVLPFILHSHLTPIGIINIGHPYKKARLIHDASFWPEPWAVAINDMTDCSTQPPITFGPAFDTFLLWVANLRASHPTDEIYLGEDDVGGAFRHNKYHPDVVGAHAYELSGYGVLATGSTFGGTTSPPNWNAVAACRQARAQWLWLQPDTVDKAKPFLPSVVFAADPSPTDVASFSRIEIDSKVTGVINHRGRRLPPPFTHHVDDCCYADTREHMLRTVSASAVALYDVLGYPDPRVPNPLSQDKLNTTYSHTRKICGYLVDSRRMTVGLHPTKCPEVVRLLSDWCSKRRFTLREAAQLVGLFDSLCRYQRWGRPYLASLQHAIRRELGRRYRLVIAQRRFKQRNDELAATFPQWAHYRLASFLARDRAAFMWHSRHTLELTPHIAHSLRHLHAYLAVESNHWDGYIAHIVPRDPHATSLGDASNLGGGAYSPELRYWFDIQWSPRVQHGLSLKTGAADFVHINSLEFIVMLLQLAAATEQFASLPDDVQRNLFPSGRVSAFPVLLILTDNMAAAKWASALSWTTENNQNLIAIYAQLLRRTSIGINAEHIPGTTNVVADFLSRPDLSLTRSSRLTQIFRQHSFLQTWPFFRPSRTLLRLLTVTMKPVDRCILGIPWPRLGQSTGFIVTVTATVTSS